MIILGIDPGLATTGIGIVDGEKKDAPKALDWPPIQTPAKVSTPDRLAELVRDLRGILDEYKPVLVVLETLFFSTNVKTAIDVAQARGAMLAELGARGLPVLEVGPMQVKSAITGDGHADKLQMQTMLKNIFHLDAAPSPDDAADALALALYGAYHGTLH